MEIVMNFFSKIWNLFWSIWPKNYLLLIIISAMSEVLSLTFFRLGGNRGILAVLGYILGFLGVAFYAEGLKYSSLAISYPVWLGAVAILVSGSAFLIFHEQISTKWIIGFILTLIGVLLIQTSISGS